MSSIPIRSTSNSSRQIAATVSSICPTGATYAAVERGRRCAADRGRPAARLGGKPREHARERWRPGRVPIASSTVRRSRSIVVPWLGRELLRLPQELEAQVWPGNDDERDRVVRGVGTDEQTNACVAPSVKADSSTT